MWDALLDLAAGSVCVVCTRPGRALCRRCHRALPGAGAPARPTPCPPGLVPVHATGDYDGALRALVLAHKEHAVHGLAVPLGDLLAVAVTAALRAEVGRAWPYPPSPAGPVVLVPVPSHPRVVRERGHDPLLRLTRRAATALRRDGVPVSVARPLLVVGRPRDQAGLTAQERAANLAGRFAARAGPGPGDPGAVVLVDDVLTTGWTLRSAQAALEQRGWAPVAGATVAATRRHRRQVVPPAPGVPDLGVLLPRSPPGH
ncbi:ComF family protein [Nocardioides marmoribigeumensis]|uniref:Amidophosphoribosyltransferase n=1 Tax=Nocardioides marmoribigeumensis TaxID=433649 RepID=A0ABU2C031_9ACTN|nr:ComF family protein [Nocardioides marmoribigeumensis]MDR7364027.1 putative amidophosphoribosyltransferase [Nocardioides marmoribigeumensis]